MVWNSEQSPLYRTVESFNNSTCKPDEDPVERQCGEPKCGAAPEVGKCRSEQPRKCSPPPETSEEFCKSLPETGIRCLSSLL